MELLTTNFMRKTTVILVAIDLWKNAGFETG
jgi:hypothetical protein